MQGLTVAQRPVILVSCYVLARAQGKGASRGTPDFLPHDTDRWALQLFPTGRPARRADAAPAARTPLLIAHDRAALRPALRPLSPCRPRLPRLRAQRLAR